MPVTTEVQPRRLAQLYWVMRIGMAFIWLWTAMASWLFYPRQESLAWLERLGLGHQAYPAFLAACVLDLVFGIASAFFARKFIWQLQFVVVTVYSAVILIGLPEFLFHPFGPITKNVAVLACLAYLTVMERRKPQ